MNGLSSLIGFELVKRPVNVELQIYSPKHGRSNYLHSRTIEGEVVPGRN